MNVKEIVVKYLEDNGYDGLYTEDSGCRGSDLMPCLGVLEFRAMANCQAGYIRPCPDTENCKYCETVWDCMKCPGAFIGPKPKVKP